MNKALSQKKRGFISTIILILIGLLTLQFAFHIDVLAILQSPQMLAISHFIIKYSVIAWGGLVGLYHTVFS